MRDTDNFFFQLNEPAGTEACLIESFLPKATWHWVPYVTICENIELIEQDFFNASPLLKAIETELEPVLALYKFPSSSFYEWHTDTFVGSSLNMVLKHYNASTLFSESTDRQEVFKITPLEYQPYRWYAFNSQAPHCVINHGSEDRVLLTVTFSRDFTYQDLCQWYSDFSRRYEHAPTSLIDVKRSNFDNF